MWSFFYGRLDSVKVSTTKSSWKEMKRGWPQASSLGLLLWNLYQKDQSHQVSNTNLPILRLARSGKPPKVLTWCSDNYLRANPIDFSCWWLNHKMIMTKPHYQSTDMSLKVLRTLGFSELLMTYTLYLANISVNSVKKKASQRLGVLSRLRNLIRTEANLLSCTEILDIAIFSILLPFIAAL